MPGADGTATVTWTTDEPATSRVDYGTSAGSLTSFVSDGTLTTSHSVELTGLSPDTTYHFRVTSTDAVPNTTISPNPPAAPATFTTPTGRRDRHHRGRLRCRHDRQRRPTCPTRPAVRSSWRRRSARSSAGAVCPSGWSTGSWTGGATTDRGAVGRRVDGSWLRADGLGAAGRAVEFVGTFSGASFQNAGFGVTLDGDPGESWAMFGTNGTAGCAAGADLTTGSFIDVRARGAVHRLGASLPDRVGHVGRPLLHRRHARPHRATTRRAARCARSPATTATAAVRCPSTGCA